MLYRITSKRPAAVILESAFVFPVIFFLLVALVVGAMGVLRYQEVAMLSQEGARYASVHGSDYRAELGISTQLTPENIFNNGIRPHIDRLGLNPAAITYSVTWDSKDAPFSVSGMTGSISDYEVPRVNTVTVTITYQWFPEMYLAGPINLTCSTTVPMCY